MRFKAIGKSANLYYDCAAAFWMPVPDKGQIGGILEAMQACAGLQGSSIELHLVDDDAIAKVNKEFLGCYGPTNIITFPPEGELPGSLLLSVDCLMRESLVYGQQVACHFLRLLAHGFGHLAGFEHGPEMSDLETACFEKGFSILCQQDPR